MKSPFPGRAGSSPTFALVLAATTAAIFAAGCQETEFEPVDPLALRSVHRKTLVTHLKPRPDLMLMVDKSYSMRLPINPTDSRCPAGCGTTQGGFCPAN